MENANGCYLGQSPINFALLRIIFLDVCHIWIYSNMKLNMPYSNISKTFIRWTLYLREYFNDAPTRVTHPDCQSRQVSLTTAAAARRGGGHNGLRARHCGQKGMTCGGGVQARPEGRKEGRKGALPWLCRPWPFRHQYLRYGGNFLSIRSSS